MLFWVVEFLEPTLFFLAFVLSFPMFLFKTALLSGFLPSFPSFTFTLQPLPARLFNQPAPNDLKIVAPPRASLVERKLELQWPHPTSGPGMHF